MRPISTAFSGALRPVSPRSTPRQRVLGDGQPAQLPSSLPTVPRRQVTIDHRPTDLARSEPGHIQLSLESGPEVALLEDALGRRLPVRLSLGLSDDHMAPPQRQAQRTSRDGVPYVNKLKPALDPLTPYPDPPRQSVFLGVLSPRQARVLAQMVRRAPATFSAAGRLAGTVPRDQWTTDDIAAHLTRGVVPDWGHNCVDFMREVVMALAALDCTDTRALQAFRRAIDQAHRPEELASVIEAHFRANAFMILSFVPPALPPLAPVVLRTTPHFDAFREASGLSPEVFDRLAAHLEQRGLIFEAIFTNPADKAWGLAFFGGLGERLKHRGAQEAVGAVCYHRDMYEGNITHVSLIAVNPAGDVCIAHHESVPLVADRKPVNNLMPGTLGLPSNAYDTGPLFEHWVAKGVARRHAELPAMRSYRRTGPPLVMFDTLRDFAALETRVETMYTRSFQADAVQWTYAADPDQRLSETTAGVRAGLVDVNRLVSGLQAGPDGLPDPAQVQQVLGLRFRDEPAVPAPGEAVPGSYVNNCSWYTLQALRAGGSVALGDRATDSTDSLADVFRTMRDIGLQPDTDPDLGDRMDRIGARPVSGEMARHTASFLMGGSADTGLASGHAGRVAPHVPGREVDDPAAPQRVQAALHREEAARARAQEAIDRFVSGLGRPPRQ